MEVNPLFSVSTSLRKSGLHHPLVIYSSELFEDSLKRELYFYGRDSVPVGILRERRGSDKGTSDGSL